MRTIVQYLNKLIFPLLPETKCFGLKRGLLRLSGAKIGNNVRICSSAMIVGAGELTIGDNTWVGLRCLICASSSIHIGKNVDIAPDVYIGDGTHEITPEMDRIAGFDTAKPIKIGDGCWICANSTILPGVTIGEKCVVASGAVVTCNFQNQLLLAGIPATIKKVLKK